MTPRQPPQKWLACVGYDIEQDKYYGYVTPRQYIPTDNGDKRVYYNDKLTALIVAAHMAIKQTEDKA
jgi:hypothetical protein